MAVSWCSTILSIPPVLRKLAKPYSQLYFNTFVNSPIVSILIFPIEWSHLVIHKIKHFSKYIWVVWDQMSLILHSESENTAGSTVGKGQKLKELKLDECTISSSEGDDLGVTQIVLMFYRSKIWSKLFLIVTLDIVLRKLIGGAAIFRKTLLRLC